MQKRTTLIAEDGKILTNGKDFARATFLAVGADESEWYEITEAEYERIMAEQEAQAQRNMN
jgi:hypothetical protein